MPILFNNDGALDKFHPTDAELKQINKFTNIEYSKEELFVIKRRACGNRVDRSFELFSDKALSKIAKLVPGTPALIDHVNSQENIWGKNFAAKVEIDPSQKGVLEREDDPDYRYVKVSQYTPRTEGNRELLEKMVAGLDDKVSVGFNFNIKDLTCEICGEAMYEFDWDKYEYKCPHIPGETYEKQVCYGNINDIYDYYELSNVAIPCQADAGTIKTLDKENLKNLTDELQQNGSLLKSVDWSSGLRSKYLEHKVNVLNKRKALMTEKKPETEAVLEEEKTVEEPITTEETKEAPTEILSVKDLDEVKAEQKKANEALDLVQKSLDEVKSAASTKDLSEGLKNVEAKVEKTLEALKVLDDLVEKVKNLTEVLEVCKTSVANEVSVAPIASPKSARTPIVGLQN